MSKLHGNIKCDCGHTQKDHFSGEGFCHHSKHKKKGQCGCTWFHPSINYIIRKIKEKRNGRVFKRLTRCV